MKAHCEAGKMQEEKKICESATTKTKIEKNAINVQNRK